jgi:DNA-binding IclR family transcriptional regulator
MDDDTNEKDAGSKTVQAVEHCCQILNYICRVEEAGVTEISTHCGMSKSTVHAQLQTLQSMGYVYQSDERYRLTLGLLYRGQVAQESLAVYQAATDEVARLAAETGATAHLMVEQSGWGYIAELQPDDGTSLKQLRLGKGYPLHQTATGKAILAFAPPERVAWILQNRGLARRTAETITDSDTLQQELDTIRDSGVAFEHGEQLAKARGVACPIVLPDAGVFGAIGCTGPESKFQGEYFESELPALLREAATSVELKLEVEHADGRGFA